MVGNWTLVLCSVASRAGFVELDCYVWVTRGMPTEAHSTSKLVGTRISEDEIVAKMGRQICYGFDLGLPRCAVLLYVVRKIIEAANEVAIKVDGPRYAWATGRS